MATRRTYPMRWARRRYGGEEAWAPTDIAGCVFSILSDEITGLNENDPIGTWSDTSGLGHDATQATESLKFLYKTNQLNGLPAAYSDGSDDLMYANGLASYFWNVLPFTYVWVGRLHAAPGSYGGIFRAANAGSTRLQGMAINGQNLMNYRGVSTGLTYWTAAYTTDTTNTHVQVLRFNGTNAQWRVDGVNKQNYTWSQNQGYNTEELIDAVKIGRFNTTLPAYHGANIMYDNHISDGDLAILESGLTAKFVG